MRAKILLFVPCYNCEPQVARVAARIARSALLPWVDEILFMNDCSTDSTSMAAQKACAVYGQGTTPWRMVSTPFNSGLGGVHKTAFNYALHGGFTHAIVLHGDDQGNPDDIVPLLRDGAHMRHGALLGSRFMRQSRLEGYSRFRIFGNHMFNALFSLALRYRVLDLGSGLNLFGTEVMGSPHLMGMADDLTFNVHLLVDIVARRQETRPLFFPVSWREDDQVSNVRLVRQTVQTARIVAWSALTPRRFLSIDHRSSSRASYDVAERGDLA